MSHQALIEELRDWSTDSQPNPIARKLMAEAAAALQESQQRCGLLRVALDEAQREADEHDAELAVAVVRAEKAELERDKAMAVVRSYASISSLTEEDLIERAVKEEAAFAVKDSQ